jgi:hypothetical protein
MKFSKPIMVGFATGIYSFGHWNPLRWGIKMLEGVEIVRWQQDWKSPLINANLEGPLQFDGVLARNGIGTHANSEIHLRIVKPATSLTVSCGYPDYVSAAKVICSIRKAGSEFASSPILSAEQRSFHFKVPVEQSEVLELQVRLAGTSGFHAHASWYNIAVGP